MIKQYKWFNFGAIAGCIIAIAFIYALLLGKPQTEFSLQHLLLFINHLKADQRLTMISLIPGYITLFLFGGGVVGTFVFGYIFYLFSTFFHHLSR